MYSVIRSFAALAFILLVGCPVSFAADVVPPTISEIEGEIVKVVPTKREIYVLSAEKKHEYYFNDKTAVLKGETAGSFEDLKTGMKVRVTANKIGKRLDPTEVKILE